ncbi:endonuclease/exonuclease/phosphatase family protein [Endozoicomonas sp. 8E]|uniref:endonuclease/exonuclease/phosphatase family protein n=1 Tax=Endozoicomonas sp. 8E TaxID=3035692 RepID=UPI002938ECE9|nr:endonuclease/exonuclease/phosphatase family protein [Endozoicomonas sp. 8E]WOG29635.1 endonuclease/exonuclease/phosphatase family protein [Endozoicomonas sp. 8E]
MTLKLIASTILVTALLTGCDKESDSDDNNTKPGYTTSLTVVTSNVWHSLKTNWNNTNSYDIAVAEFKAQSPDILFLQESKGVNARLAADLGMYLWQGKGTSAALLSKHPIKKVYDHRITDTNNNNLGAVLDINGRDVVVWSNHLDFTNYHVYDARGGNGVTWNARENCIPVQDSSELEALNRKSDRPAQTEYMLNNLEPYLEKGTAVILGGDFNEASGLDWTEETAHMYDHSGTVHDFLTHRMIRDAGLTDSYRAIYPDPVTHMGATWPAHQDDSWTSNNTYVNECGRALDDRDRIDFIYHNANAKDFVLKDVAILGPRINQFFAGPHGEDDTYTFDDPHTGLKIDEHGESHYGEREFVSDHLWYVAKYELKTPYSSPNSESIETHPTFEQVRIEAQGYDLVVRFGLSQLSTWDKDYYRQVLLVDSQASPNTGTRNSLAHISFVDEPEVDENFAIRVPEQTLREFLETSAHTLQMRLTDNSGSLHFVVHNIAREEIEALGL